MIETFGGSTGRGRVDKGRKKRVKRAREEIDRAIESAGFGRSSARVRRRRIYAT